MNMPGDLCGLVLLTLLVSACVMVDGITLPASYYVKGTQLSIKLRNGYGEVAKVYVVSALPDPEAALKAEKEKAQFLKQLEDSSQAEYTAIEEAHQSLRAPCARMQVSPAISDALASGRSALAVLVDVDGVEYFTYLDREQRIFLSD